MKAKFVYEGLTFETFERLSNPKSMNIGINSRIEKILAGDDEFAAKVEVGNLIADMLQQKYPELFVSYGYPQHKITPEDLDTMDERAKEDVDETIFINGASTIDLDDLIDEGIDIENWLNKIVDIYSERGEDLLDYIFKNPGKGKLEGRDKFKILKAIPYKELSPEEIQQTYKSLASQKIDKNTVMIQFSYDFLGKEKVEWQSLSTFKRLYKE